MTVLANEETGMPMLPTSYRANPEKMSDAPIDEGCLPMTSSGIKVPSPNTGWELRPFETSMERLFV
jgi:hypothetical protein